MGEREMRQELILQAGFLRGMSERLAKAATRSKEVKYAVLDCKEMSVRLSRLLDLKVEPASG